MVKPNQSRKRNPYTKKSRDRRQSRKQSRNRKQSRKQRQSRKHNRRQSRRRGGAEVFNGAPLAYSLSGDWSSRMSLGQGSDYFKYHEGQHGGQAPYPSAVEGSLLPDALRGPARINGLDMAFSDIKGLRDPPYDGHMMGGKRRKRGKRGKHGNKTHKGPRKHNKRNRQNRRSRRNRRKGGSLGYAPFPSPGMLLDSQKAYADAGLHPEWTTAVEFTDAKIRDTQ